MTSAGRGSNPFSQLALKRERELKEKGECQHEWGECDARFPHRCSGKLVGHGNHHKCGCGTTGRVKRKGVGRK